MKLRHLLPLSILLASTSTLASPPELLHSPWDLKTTATSTLPYKCPTIVPLSHDIFIDPAPLAEPVDFVDPADDAIPPDPPAPGTHIGPQSDATPQATRALSHFLHNVVTAADAYRDTGSLAAATCTASLLASAAADHAMTGIISSDLGWSRQNAALRAATIALLKVRSSSAVSPDQSALILAWMSDVLYMERYHYEHSHCYRKTCNLLGHRGLEVAMAAAAIAIAANDRPMYKWSLDQYRTAVEDIEPDGRLHYDNKGQYSLKFQIESAAALVTIAEYAQVNGEHLYDYDHGHIHRLIHAVTGGIMDPEPFRAVTGSTQRIPSPLAPWEISWATPYNVRFPDPIAANLLRQAGPGGSDMWGGEPLDPSR